MRERGERQGIDDHIGELRQLTDLWPGQGKLYCDIPLELQGWRDGQDPGSLYTDLRPQPGIPGGACLANLRFWHLEGGFLVWAEEFRYRQRYFKPGLVSAPAARGNLRAVGLHQRVCEPGDPTLIGYRAEVSETRGYKLLAVHARAGREWSDELNCRPLDPLRFIRGAMLRVRGLSD